MSNTKGLNIAVVRELSARKSEPAWMLAYRLKALEIFVNKPLPTWGADLSQLDQQDLYYYIKPITTPKPTWAELPAKIKTTFDRLGIPQAEQKVLAGVGAQFDSEV
ncbi:MAG TPA: Fe-S cluster assembly protein SufB, partial [Candidatus Babeliales bacterium]|nr:Fe-S cluster assembly protein SufB [Candidatus Babeliales bacterium]